MTDLQDTVGYTIQKVSVMCNHDHGSTEIPEEIFQPGNHLPVQVVGGLIQDQDVCRV